MNKQKIEIGDISKIAMQAIGDLHDTILDIARTARQYESVTGMSLLIRSAPTEPRIFCAVRQDAKVWHLSWLRQRDIERMPAEFLRANVRMGARSDDHPK